MSIASEITRLQNAKSALKTSINAKTDQQHQIGNETLEDYSSFVDSIQTGGGEGEKDVFFYDYDGELVESYTATEFQELTEMPTQPTHTGLVADGWNWSLADAKEYVTTYGGLIIGGMYNTSSGGTRIYVTLNSGTLNPLLSLGFEGDITVDWGDNTTETFTGLSSDINNYISHTYQTAGNYTIEITNGNIPITIFGYGTTTYQFSRLLCGGESNLPSEGQRFLNTIKKIEIGNNVLLGLSAFANMFNLETVSFPSYISFTNNYAFNKLYKLKAMVVPSGGTFTNFSGGPWYDLSMISFPKQIALTGTLSLTSSAFDKITLPSGTYTISIGSNKKLKKVIMPNTVKTGSSLFYNCTLLETFKIPTNGNTSIPTQAFQNTNLKELTIPSNITSIENNAFQNCNIKEITIPSTVSSIGTQVFYSMPLIKKIKNYSNKLNNYLFSSNYNLEEVEMTFSGVTTIPMSCFENDYKLKILALDSAPNLTTIYSSFKNCYSLELNSLPNTVTYINANAFENCFSLNLSSLPPSITEIYQSSFAYCDNCNLKTLPDTVTKLNALAFAGNNFKQLSMNGITTMSGSSTSNGPFCYMPNIVAFWIGSSITSGGLLRYSLSTGNVNNYKRIYINLPRATVEGFANYNYAFCNNSNKKSIIVCNDDAGWLTKEQFDAIDWETYTP